MQHESLYPQSRYFIFALNIKILIYLQKEKLERFPLNSYIIFIIFLKTDLNIKYDKYFIYD
jgi:hypothetical protein